MILILKVFLLLATVCDILMPLNLIKDEEIAIENQEVYLNKVARRVKEYEVKILNELRTGKKLLVLDIDYTLFDHKTTAQSGMVKL